jgi:microcystin-dependent protein
MSYWNATLHAGDELPPLSDPEGLDAHAVFHLGVSVVGGNKRGLYVARENNEYAAISPVGMVGMWPISTPPMGWLICDGSAISRTAYSDLFDILGTTYGVGDGSTTFNLPDFKGRVPAGTDSGQSEFQTEGTSGGEKTHTLDITVMPSHSHTQQRYPTTTGGSSGFSADTSMSGTQTDLTLTTKAAGGGAAHNNLQPYLTLNFIIKA